MKQTITKENWNELSDEEASKLLNFIMDSLMEQGMSHPQAKDEVLNHATIGQLIEYLGDDFWKIDKGINGYAVQIELDSGGIESEDKELIDALWEATKHKLRDK